MFRYFLLPLLLLLTGPVFAQPGETELDQLDAGLGLPLDQLEADCEAGVQAACVNLGRYLAYGVGGAEQDEARAQSLFDPACTAGWGLACLELARRQFGAPAAELYQRACDLGQGAGCDRVARRRLSLAQQILISGAADAAAEFDAEMIRIEADFERGCLEVFFPSADACTGFVIAVLSLDRPDAAPPIADARIDEALAVGCEAGRNDSLGQCITLRTACELGYQPACEAWAPALVENCARNGVERSCLDFMALVREQGDLGVALRAEGPDWPGLARRACSSRAEVRADYLDQSRTCRAATSACRDGVQDLCMALDALP